MSVHHARTKHDTTSIVTMDAAALSIGILLLDKALRLIRP